jgi:hypothetical protein
MENDSVVQTRVRTQTPIVSAVRRQSPLVAHPRLIQDALSHMVDEQIGCPHSFF